MQSRAEPFSPVMAGQQQVFEDETEADRLRLLMAAENMTPRAFAGRLQVSYNRLNNVIGMNKPLGKDLAFAIVRTIPGMSLDWLWHGRREALSSEMDRKLNEARARRGLVSGE